MQPHFFDKDTSIKIQDVLETIADACCVVDRQSRIVYINLRACEMGRGTPETFIGQVCWKVFAQITGRDAEKLLHGAIETTSTVEYEISSPDTATSLWVRACPMSGGLTALCWRDISKQKRSEAALRESEERFRQFFEHSPLGMAIADSGGRFRDANPALCKTLGYASEELTCLSYNDIVHPDDREEFARRESATVAGATLPFRLESRVLRKSGEAMRVNIKVSPLHAQNGRAVCTLGIVESVEPRVVAEKGLQHDEELLEQRIEERTRYLFASQAWLKAHFNNSPDWLTLFRARKDGSFVYEDLNRATERAYGMKRSQVIGRTPQEVLGPDQAQLPLQHMRACLRTGESRRYTALRTIGGATRTIDVVFSLVPQREHGEEPLLVAAARDITDLRQIEDRLHQAQKLEAIGQLTGGIVHDFNNLLTSILGNLELLTTRLSARDPSSARMLAAALRAAERGARLTTRLLAFSRRQRVTPEAVDLNRIVTGMSGLLQSTVGATSRIETSFAEPLSLVLVDPSQIELALLNLVINARDAMPEGGTITISTSNVRLCTPSGPEAPSPGDYVMFSVTDTGTGIREEIIDKVFEPFFTTKEVGKGSGLGLSQVLGVAKKLGGGVRIKTKLGFGTTVSVYFPRAEGKLASGPETPAPCLDRETGDVRRAVVLLVDDDSDARAGAAEMLRYAGHTVVEAGGGREALYYFDREDDRIDLMLVDCVMPDMNGIETARLARLRRPGLPIMFMTGFADSAIFAAQSTAEQVLQKPFRPSDLAVKVEEALRRAFGRSPDC
jgi:PAS domain S-box-containing protein